MKDSVKDSASISFCTAVVGVLHFLMMFLFVSYLGFEVKCIALSGDVSNFNLVAFLFISITFLEEKLSSDEEEEVIEESYEDSVREWKKLSGLAIPSFGLLRSRDTGRKRAWFEPATWSEKRRHCQTRSRSQHSPQAHDSHNKEDSFLI
ncbi:hypothetical protein Bca52824_057869 [Brassica carinata]|uniref:Transmembrane protein n=1 Tax=Brassica carinata TaxID=52824 RepID=A0A8X7QRA5_BRACI|nr:hypothetical protein Bca52824_057869 [Brassica carinata]